MRGRSPESPISQTVVKDLTTPDARASRTPATADARDPRRTLQTNFDVPSDSELMGKCVRLGAVAALATVFVAGARGRNRG